MPHTLYRLCLTLLVAFAVIGTAPPDSYGRGDPDNRNDLPGRAQWEWKLFNAKGKLIDKGKFTAYLNGDVRQGNERIGSWKFAGKNTFAVRLSEGKLRGTGELHRDKGKTPTYSGKLKQRDGDKVRLVIKLLED
jgi:hypothetical protein